MTVCIFYFPRLRSRHNSLTLFLYVSKLLFNAFEIWFCDFFVSGCNNFNVT